MSGKGDKPRKFTKEASQNYSNNKFWDNLEKQKGKNKEKH